VPPAVMAATKVTATTSVAAASATTTAAGLSLVSKAQGTQACENENYFFHFIPFV
jgi:hypothetical protein